MWQEFSTSATSFSEFWELKCGLMPEPRTKDSISPLRKLYSLFIQVPQRGKLALFLIYKALDHPAMVFYGLGIYAHKSMIYTSLNANARPLEKLLTVCKTVFKGLQEDHPELFGDPAQVDELFYRPAVEKVASVVFVKQATVRSKRKSLRSSKSATVDEICILDNVARFVNLLALTHWISNDTFYVRRYSQGTQGLTPYRSQMRSYLRSLVRAFGDIPLHRTTGKQTAERIVRLDAVKPIFAERFATFINEQTIVQDDMVSGGDTFNSVDAVAWADFKVSWINDLIDGIPPISKGYDNANRECMVDALYCLLSPRMALTPPVWQEAMRLVVCKLPGGKLFTQGPGGIWHRRRLIYYEKAPYEADAVMYLFLCILLQDIKLVQYFLTGPKHVKDAVRLHDAFTKIILFDRVWCHCIEEKNKDVEEIDWKTSPAYDGIASRALQKMLLKIENDSDGDNEDSEGEDGDMFACSDTVANALTSCEYDE
jgi:hypothetical protein